MDKKIKDVLNTNNSYWENKRKIDVISVYDDYKVKDALKILADNKILSLPVKERSTGDYLGFIDMNDILHSIIDAFLLKYPQKEGHDWVRLCNDVSEGEKFAEQPVFHLINQSKRDHFIPVDENGSIHQLVDEIFSKDIHRVVVIDEDANTKGIMSQTDILEFILENKKEIGDGKEFEQPISELDIIEKDLLSINCDVMTIQCYYVMMQQNKSSIVLHGKDGEIVGDLSITDLRGIDPDSFKLLLEPAKDFYKITSARRKKDSVVPLNTKFKDALQILYKNRLHRLWLTCDKKSCFGMLSISNIMKYFARDYKERTPQLHKEFKPVTPSRVNY
ncbi:hypothetical protein DICPUDRAFT_147104 [Dictyostelium purpureum]|uniref:CBS domain-containing protein n=1 Tax=Dictyostelium purpureum TaxID=5786 RepID=F0Z7N8_DICPU|nr:uncharacterized protein DICPUDRAFT_147104 [Dictyostelium purpureum]EGC40047.1 hypothetical protein DICPUDRAFT_147104 [Dictyostelium purpureum]|eukprot:XP_003283396.1 hypothetical protein DICPUDRAFT_147104 [Dictyostelium purpureum]